MRYLSVCSGIEAATVAWHGLGWTPVGFSEIEPFPSAVLAHHYPNTPNFGDMTKHEQWPLQPGSVDLLVGGTPCQSFSVAGLRKGLHDPRGGLMLTYLEIARRLRPRWVVWENVPGVLSSNGGRDFGSFLGALGELGYGWAYRVLDAQWCRTHGHPRAVPQRRRRVFVVGCLGDGAAAAQVLFERESVQRDSSSRRTPGQGASADAEGCAGTVSSKWAKGTGGPAGDECYNLTTQPTVWPANCAGTLGQSASGTGSPGYSNQEIFSQNAANLIPQPIPFTKAKRAQSVTDDETWVDGQVNPTLSLFDQGDTRATTVAVGFNWQNGGGYGNANDGLGITVEGTGPLQRCNTPAVAFQQNQLGEVRCGNIAGTVNTNSNASGRNTPMVAHAVKVGSGIDIPSPPAVACCVAPTITAGNDPSRSPQSSEVTQQVAAVHAASMTVRRLTARECERLQAFPDDYTLIPWRKKQAEDCPDGPRYKALGNSMAVNCMAWIGERIAALENNR